MGWLIVVTIVVFLLMLFYTLNQGRLKKTRANLIDTYTFPEAISLKVRSRYPHLTEKETELVIYGLREYFHVCNISGKNMVSMPSQVVDIAWHEFILYTKKYEYFCSRAIGRFLHHTPAEAMDEPTLAQSGIKRAWRFSCYRVQMNHLAPTILPILFSIDSDLNIEDGFKYSMDCTRSDVGGFCAGHIGCGSGCGSGSGGAGESGSDGGGCGSGCGGS